MSEPKTVCVAAVQMEPLIGEVDANLRTILTRFREATAAGARLVVFPECALSGYGFDSREEALPFAEPIPGLSTREIAAACSEANAFAIYGLLERDGERLFNVSVLVGPNGWSGRIARSTSPSSASIASLILATARSRSSRPMV